MPGCELYWISVSTFPPAGAERDWLTDFILRLHKHLAEQHGLRGEFFLQQKSIARIEKRFRKLALDLLPKLGLARRPNAPLPPPPTTEQLRAAVKGEPFDITDHMPDYCYWFHSPNLEMLLTEFFGQSGSLMFYLKPDPATEPPEIPYLKEFEELFPAIPWDKAIAMMQAGFAMKDGFLQKSKQLFGEGLQQEPEYEGYAYIVPLLSTADFFNQPETERKKWFELFDVFWRESPADKGIYIASKLPVEKALQQILESMKEEGKPYPKR